MAETATMKIGDTVFTFTSKGLTAEWVERRKKRDTPKGESRYIRWRLSAGDGFFRKEIIKPRH